MQFFNMYQLNQVFPEEMKREYKPQPLISCHEDAEGRNTQFGKCYDSYATS